MEKSATDFFHIFFQEDKPRNPETYKKKVCGYPNKSLKKIENDFSCSPGCERVFSKHFDESEIPFHANNKTFNLAGFLHDSLEVIFIIKVRLY